MNTRKRGAEYERQAAEFLKNQGYEILEYNFRSPYGEIDLVARQDNCLVFVEVKYRKSAQCGGAAFAVGTEKQRRLSRTAVFYCVRRGIAEDAPCRFDVVAVTGTEFTHYENAFDFRR